MNLSWYIFLGFCIVILGMFVIDIRAYKKRQIKTIEQSVLIKRTKKLEFFDAQYDVKVASIRLKFDDGTTFDVKYYGHCYQCRNSGRDNMQEPSISPVTVLTANQLLNEKMFTPSLEKSSYVDDRKNTLKYKVGIVVEYEVICFDEYIETFKEARIVDKTEGEE